MISLYARVLVGAGLFLCSIPGSAFLGAREFDQDLSKLKVVTFFSQGCPCSRSHVVHLNRLVSQFPEVSFYGVITDKITESNRKEIESYFSKKGFAFPLVEDSSLQLVSRYRALKTPHATILRKDSGGHYQVLYQGGVSDSRDFSRAKKKFLRENLDALSNGKPLVYSHGPSLGCYIRRI